MKDLSSLYALFECMCRAGSLEGAFVDAQLVRTEREISAGFLYPTNINPALLEQAKINAACAWIHSDGSAPSRKAYGDLVGKSFTRGAIQVTPGYVLSVLIKNFPDHLSRFLAQVLSVADGQQVVLNHFGEHVDGDMFQERITELKLQGMQLVAFDAPELQLFRRYGGVYDHDGRLLYIKEVFADDHMIVSGSRVYHWDIAVPDPYGFLTSMRDVCGSRLRTIMTAETENKSVGSATWSHESDSFTIVVRPEKFAGWRPAGIPDNI